MKTEWIKIARKETAIKIRNTKIEGVRNKNIVSKGVRVYENGCIGISGCIGDTPDETLLSQAKENLLVHIEYPFELENSHKDHRDYRKEKISPEALYDYTSAVLDILRSEYPQFDFSETSSIYDIHYTMQNTEGLDLVFQDSVYDFSLILKDKKTANLFDGFLTCTGRKMDIESFWKANHPLLKAYSTPVPLPDRDKLPVIFIGYDAFSGFLNRCLNGEAYGTGSSLFSGKLNQKLFDSRINVFQYANPERTLSPFFDAEGVTLKNDAFPLISEGVFKCAFTDKKTANQFNLPHTGAATGAYDSIPTLGGVHLNLQTDTADLNAVLGGKPAVLVMISSGGDFTPDGDYAAPVQVSFLYENGIIAGKLPEFSVRSSLYKALGDDYLGTFDNTRFYIGDINNQLFVAEMDIVR